jgi:hypothetical protein
MVFSKATVSSITKVPYMGNGMITIKNLNMKYEKMVKRFILLLIVNFKTKVKQKMILHIMFKVQKILYIILKCNIVSFSLCCSSFIQIYCC